MYLAITILYIIIVLSADILHILKIKDLQIANEHVLIPIMKPLSWFMIKMVS